MPRKNPHLPAVQQANRDDHNRWAEKNKTEWPDLHRENRAAANAKYEKKRPYSKLGGEKKARILLAKRMSSARARGTLTEEKAAKLKADFLSVFPGAVLKDPPPTAAAEGREEEEVDVGKIMPNIVVDKDELERIDAGLSNKFRWQWLTETDPYGDPYADYLKKVDAPGVALCTHCGDYFKYDGGGISLIKRHSLSKKHALARDKVPIDQQMPTSSDTSAKTKKAKYGSGGGPTQKYSTSGRHTISTTEENTADHPREVRDEGDGKEEAKVYSDLWQCQPEQYHDLSDVLLTSAEVVTCSTTNVNHHPPPTPTTPIVPMQSGPSSAESATECSTITDLTMSERPHIGRGSIDHDNLQTRVCDKRVGGEVVTLLTMLTSLEAANADLESRAVVLQQTQHRDNLVHFDNGFYKDLQRHVGNIRDFHSSATELATSTICYSTNTVSSDLGQQQQHPDMSDMLQTVLRVLTCSTPNVLPAPPTPSTTNVPIQSSLSSTETAPKCSTSGDSPLPETPLRPPIGQGSIDHDDLQTRVCDEPVVGEVGALLTTLSSLEAANADLESRAVSLQHSQHSHNLVNLDPVFTKDLQHHVRNILNFHSSAQKLVASTSRDSTNTVADVSSLTDAFLADGSVACDISVLHDHGYAQHPSCSTETGGNVKAHHTYVTPSGTRIGSYTCYHCKTVFQHPPDLYKHTTAHTCTVCHQSFCQLSYLNEHCKTHTEDLHTCNQCSQTFADQAQLIKHMAAHTKPTAEQGAGGNTPGLKLYVCNICGEQFRTLDVSYLNEHFKTHTKDRHTCTKCSRTFADSAELVKHMASHDTSTTNTRCNTVQGPGVKAPVVKLYVCSKCGQQFSTLEDATTHAQTHSQGAVAGTQTQIVTNTHAQSVKEKPSSVTQMILDVHTQPNSQMGVSEDPDAQIVTNRHTENHSQGVLPEGFVKDEPDTETQMVIDSNSQTHSHSQSMVLQEEETDTGTRLVTNTNSQTHIQDVIPEDSVKEETTGETQMVIDTNTQTHIQSIVPEPETQIVANTHAQIHSQGAVLEKSDCKEEAVTVTPIVTDTHSQTHSGCAVCDHSLCQLSYLNKHIITHA